jgi:CheY-like chemotaxis protein
LGQIGIGSCPQDDVVRTASRNAERYEAEQRAVDQIHRGLEDQAASPKIKDNVRMTRPCFLVIDREFAGSISTRKLVIETAKFNVITAYSGHEAVATLKRFPNMDGVVMDADIQDMSCPEMVQALKALHPGIPVIAICSPRQNK